MGSTLTYRSTSMNLNTYMGLFITPFSICFVGVAQLTLGRIVSVSLPCPVRWLMNLCLHCSCTYSFSLFVTNCLSNQFYSQLQPCLLFSVLSVFLSCSEIYLKKRKKVSVFHQHVVTTFSLFPAFSAHLFMSLVLSTTVLLPLKDKRLPFNSALLLLLRFTA